MKIISGMHRSGTSLVARLFYEIGADLGDPEKFYRPDKWNPDGYFEQPEIHSINFRLINGPWWKFAYFNLPSTTKILKRAEKHADQIRKISCSYEDKVVKEARFSLTLPAWLKYGCKVTNILVCLREPIQVAHSLQKRNRITINYALKLWYIHNYRLLENACDILLRFVNYENFFDARLFCLEMKSSFDFFGYSISNDQLDLLRKKIVRPKTNHSTKNSYKYSQEIDILWNDLLKKHKAQFLENS
jgi:hypothetical protein